MSKLIYPDTGLTSRCRGSFSMCAEEISKAISNCSFDIPSDFCYRTYLRGLSTSLNTYRRDINSVGTKIESTDRSFNFLADQLVSSANKITAPKIAKRDRLIK